MTCPRFMRSGICRRSKINNGASRKARPATGLSRFYPPATAEDTSLVFSVIRGQTQRRAPSLDSGAYTTCNAFQAFVTNAERTALLQHVHAHLADDGLFAFETRNPLLPGVTTRTQEVMWPSYINVDGRAVRVSTTQVCDHAAQVVHLTGYERRHDGSQEHTKITRTALRYTFPQELAALLQANGFVRLHEYGDWDKQPLPSTAPASLSSARNSPLPADQNSAQQRTSPDGLSAPLGLSFYPRAAQRRQPSRRPRDCGRTRRCVYPGGIDR